MEKYETWKQTFDTIVKNLKQEKIPQNFKWSLELLSGDEKAVFEES